MCCRIGVSHSFRSVLRLGFGVEGGEGEGEGVGVRVAGASISVGSEFEN